MSDKIPLERLKEYDCYLQAHAGFRKKLNNANIISGTIHIVMLIVFMTNFYAYSGWGIVKGFGKIPVIKDIPVWLPFYAKNFWTLLLCGILSVFVIPRCVGGLYLKFAKMRFVASQDISELPDEEYTSDFLQERIKKYDYNYFDCGCSLSMLSVIASLVLGWMGAGFLGAVGLLIVVTFLELFSVSIIGGVLDSSEYAQNLSGLKDLKNDLAAYERQEHQEEERRKEEEERRKEEEKRFQAEEEKRRKEEEELLRRGQEAEKAFLAMENPADNEELVKHLADEGSSSACAAAGQIVYLDYCKNPHTKVEKEALAKEAKDYLQVSARAGNVESQFLLLSLRAMSEAHVYSEWDALLKEARAIQGSGELPERYSEPMTDLQQAIVDVMDSMDTAPKEEMPRIKRTYCKFCASGTCTFYSTASYLAKCNHLNDPGNCYTALTEKGYTVEFY